MRVLVLAAVILALPLRADESPRSAEPQLVETEVRPTMRQFPEAVGGESPPTARELVDARAEFGRRFPGLLARGRTTVGAAVIPDALIEAAVSEEDRGVKWLMLAEARRMAVAAGDAETLDRSIILASATYEFDAEAEELRSLKEIPLRLVAPERAVGFAQVAEKVAERAAADGRRDVAIKAYALAIRGWQRAGAIDAARKAVVRHDELAAGK